MMRRAVFLFLLFPCGVVLRPGIGLAAENILPVPFIVQKPNYCGPAALAMLANYYGHPVSQDDIAGAIYLPDIGGTLTSELGGYARRFHLWVRQYHGSLGDLREKLAAGVPLLVLGRFGEHPHYFVVLGWDSFRQVVTVRYARRKGRRGIYRPRNAMIWACSTSGPATSKPRPGSTSPARRCVLITRTFG
jgi:hypothetical protein